MILQLEKKINIKIDILYNILNLFTKFCKKKIPLTVLTPECVYTILIPLFHMLHRLQTVNTYKH